MMRHPAIQVYPGLEIISISFSLWVPSECVVNGIPLQRVMMVAPAMVITVPAIFATPCALLIFTCSILVEKRRNDHNKYDHSDFSYVQRYIRESRKKNIVQLVEFPIWDVGSR